MRLIAPNNDPRLRVTSLILSIATYELCAFSNLWWARAKPQAVSRRLLAAKARVTDQVNRGLLDHRDVHSDQSQLVTVTSLQVSNTTPTSIPLWRMKIRSSETSISCYHFDVVLYIQKKKLTFRVFTSVWGDPHFWCLNEGNGWTYDASTMTDDTERIPKQPNNSTSVGESVSCLLAKSAYYFPMCSRSYFENVENSILNK